MKLSKTQRSLFLLGMVIAVAALPLLGAFHHHHHHDEATGACWFCTTAAAALLPLLVIVVACPEVPLPFAPLGTNAPSWFLWMARHRRGPPLSV